MVRHRIGILAPKNPFGISNTTVLQYYHTTLLQYYSTTTLQYDNNKILQYNPEDPYEPYYTPLSCQRHGGGYEYMNI